jgi:hypothetical protein
MRDVTIPVGAVANVDTDDVTLSLTKDQVGALPEIAVSRWLASSQHGHDHRVRPVAEARAL